MTSKEYDALIKKHPHLADTGNRTCTKPKEWEGMEWKVPNVQPKGSRMEEEGNFRFKITITLLASDRRKRDLDNGASTILDCLIALRRQLRSDYGITSTREKSA